MYKRSWDLALLLALATAMVYAPVLNNGFVNLDDNGYVVRNPQVTGGLSLRNVVWSFTSVYEANWHPLTWLSHMLDAQLFGLKAWGHHLTSLVLHILNVLLLFWLLGRMTGSVWRSALVAALFAVHPLHVESVAWVAERKDVLSTFFWLATMLAYVRYAQRPVRGAFTPVVVLYALGLMAKPMLVSLPLALLIIDWWPLQRVAPRDLEQNEKARPWKALIVEKLPLFVLAAISCVVTVIAQRAGGAVQQVDQFPIAARVGNAVTAYVGYLFKMVWPADLACFYPYPKSISWLEVAAAAAALVIVTWLALRTFRRKRYVAAGWLWYLATLLPVIGLVQVGAQSMADRYTYVPLIGVFVIITWGAADLLGRAMLSHEWVRKAAIVTAGAALLALGGAARMQVVYWHDGIALFRHALEATDDNWLAHHNLATILAQQGRLEEATYEEEEAVRIKPHYSKAHAALGAFLSELGRDDEALSQLKLALASDPDDPTAHNTLANVLAKQGRYREAEREYRIVLKDNPGFSPALNNLGLALERMNRPKEAMAQFKAAIRITPDDLRSHYNLGDLLTTMGKHDEAVRQFEKVVRLKPKWAQGHCKLAAALCAAGDYSGAWKHVHLARDYGEEPPSELTSALSQKMPEPRQ